MPDNPLSLVTLLGAAGALLYVLKLIVDGKLHSSSEVDGLKQDKKDLIESNEDLTQALGAANQQLSVALGILKDHRDGR